MRIHDASITAALRTWRRDEVPRRALWAACLGLLAVLIVPVTSAVDAIETLEGKSLDARFATIPRRAPHPGILLLAIDDDSLQED